EFVSLGDTGADQERRLRRKQRLLERVLGERCQSQDHSRVVAHGAASLTVGIGASSRVPPSRSRSSLASEFASASALASEGSGSATVTATVVVLCSSPFGGR